MRHKMKHYQMFETAHKSRINLSKAMLMPGVTPGNGKRVNVKLLQQNEARAEARASQCVWLCVG